MAKQVTMFTIGHCDSTVCQCHYSVGHSDFTISYGNDRTDHSDYTIRHYGKSVEI